MISEKAKRLIKEGNQLLDKRTTLLSLFQTIAENFYVERADFTSSRNLGAEFADGLATSYPLLACRELRDAIGAMLRPKHKEWFKVGTSRPDREDQAAKQWLEWATGVQRRAMYDPDAQMVRATNEGDGDFAAFGQCAISVELNRNRDRLLFRCWHLRDVAWCEGIDGKIDTVHRKWKPTARDLLRLFPGKTDPAVERIAKDDPYAEIECRHIIVPADNYETLPGKAKRKTPRISIYIDVQHEHVMEETGIWGRHYVIPRWKTVSGSQYANSPATTIALPDARLIQAMTQVLLDAGEMAVKPPLLARREFIRADVALYAGGLTWADVSEDTSLREALLPIFEEAHGGLPIGMQMRDDTRAMIGEAFFLSKLSPLPATNNPEMTAFETGQRIQDYIRQALPLFEPMETNYNGGICDEAFDLLLRNGGFGRPDNIPQSIAGADVQFTFQNPLSEAIERQKGQRFTEAGQLLAEAMQIDPSVVVNVDIQTAFRDALEGIGVPAKWITSEEDANAALQKRQQAEKAAQVAKLAAMGGQAAEQIGKGGKAMAEAVGAGQQAAAA